MERLKFGQPRRPKVGQDRAGVTELARARLPQTTSCEVRQELPCVSRVGPDRAAPIPPAGGGREVEATQEAKWPPFR